VKDAWVTGFLAGLAAAGSLYALVQGWWGSAIMLAVLALTLWPWDGGKLRHT
jgi:hypothetical protein